jgi:chromosome segregation ATPase
MQEARMPYWTSPFPATGSLIAHLQNAGLHRWQGEQDELPPDSTLVVYPSPDLALTASLEDLESSPDLDHLLQGYRHVHRLSSSYPVMAAWRLESLSVTAIAQWLKGEALPNLDCSFPSLDPLHAILVVNLLSANPTLLQVFLDVELNAELANGQPDVDYLQRLRRAASNPQQSLAAWWRYCRQSEVQRKDLESLQDSQIDQARSLEALSMQLAESQREREHLLHEISHGREGLDRNQQQLYQLQEELESCVLKLRAFEELSPKNEESLQELHLLRELRDEQARGIEVLWTELTTSRREQERMLQENVHFREEIEQNQQQLYQLQEDLERSALKIKAGEQVSQQNVEYQQELELLRTLRDEQVRSIELLASQLADSEQEKEQLLQEAGHFRDELERCVLVIKASEELGRRIKEYQRELELLQSLRDEQARSIESLSTQLSESQRELERVLKEHGDTKEEVQRNQQQIYQLQEENERSLLLIKAGEQVSHQNQEYQQELELLRTSRDEQARNIDVLWTELTELRRERERLLQENALSRDEMEWNQQQLHHLQEELERYALMVKASEELSRQNDEYQHQLELLRSLRDEQARSIEALSSQLADSQQERERVLPENDHSREENVRNQQQMHELQVDLERSLLRIKADEELVRQIEEHREELELLCKVRDEQARSIESLSSQLADSEVQQDRLLEENHNSAKESENLRHQLYRLQEDLERYLLQALAGHDLATSQDTQLRRAQALLSRLDPDFSVGIVSRVVEVDVLPPLVTEHNDEGSVQMKALLSSYAKSLQRAKTLLQRSMQAF